MNSPLFDVHASHLCIPITPRQCSRCQGRGQEHICCGPCAIEQLQVLSLPAQAPGPRPRPPHPTSLLLRTAAVHAGLISPAVMAKSASGGLGATPLSSLPPAAAAYVTALNNSDVAAEYVTKLKVGGRVGQVHESMCWACRYRCERVVGWVHMHACTRVLCELLWFWNG